MIKIGSNSFLNCIVPLVFMNRYFIMFPGNPPLFSVVVLKDNKPFFEILNNEPFNNEVTKVTTNPTGIITVCNRITGEFIYKYRPESETSIVFGTLEHRSIEARISDIRIKVGSITIENNKIINSGAGVIIDEHGIRLGGNIPRELWDFLNPSNN